ncbi:septum formation family protein [Aquihabitans sp. G128]|uniref:septum formation family protein n=1 Tax=Aquihabitans sp. G128 TaxID=2849779 RepID=UPI001C22BA8B|nr:septum formation family protein [Aquihabitans sp. G128]QXC59532.1 septum formation family protein [Aquihabitans sp. G128]
MASARPTTSRLLLAAALSLAVVACSASGERSGTTLPKPSSPSTTAAPGRTTTTGGKDTTTTTTEPRDDDGVEPVAVGTCWAPSTPEELREVSQQADEVDCDEPHGSITVATGTIPDDLAAKLSAKVLDGNPDDSSTYEPVQAAGSAVCTGEWKRVEKRSNFDPKSTYASSVRRATKLVRTFWLPTGDQWDAGARWVQCDLQTADGTEFELDLDGLSQLATRNVPADLVLCLTDDAGDGTPVPCDSSLARWQATTVLQVAADQLPKDQAGYEAVQLKGVPVCGQLTKRAVGDVGQRFYKLFADSSVELFDGSFTCAVSVKPPVTKPLGT